VASRNETALHCRSYRERFANSRELHVSCRRKKSCISIHTRLFIHATSLRVLVCRAKLCRFPWKTYPVPANATRFVSFRFVAPRTNAHGVRFFRKMMGEGRARYSRRIVPGCAVRLVRGTACWRYRILTPGGFW